MVCLLALLASAAAPAQGEEAVQRGEVAFEPAANEAQLAPRFQLKAHRFAFEQQPIATSAESMLRYDVRFPSPVVTPHEENNTVHCEYYRPAAPGKYPAVVVLHILGGDFDLMRLYCRTFAHHGVCALFLKMPYYGPRRPPAMQRMVSPDPNQTVERMTQAVLDIRRATAWLGEQEEVDGDRLGVFGISLGGITAALAASAEPRLHNVFLMLAGADLRLANWEARELKPAIEQWRAQGGTRETLCRELLPIDPVSYPEQLQRRNVQMLSCRFDEVIPPACGTALWETCGKPSIEWLDAGHYSVGRFIFDSLGTVTRFYQQAKTARAE